MDKQPPFEGWEEVCEAILYLKLYSIAVFFMHMISLVFALSFSLCCCCFCAHDRVLAPTSPSFAMTSSTVAVALMMVCVSVYPYLVL